MNQPCKLSVAVIWTYYWVFRYLLSSTRPEAFTRKITLSPCFLGGERYIPSSTRIQVDRSSYGYVEARVKRSREPAGSHKLRRFKRLGALSDEETILRFDHHGYALSHGLSPMAWTMFHWIAELNVTWPRNAFRRRYWKWNRENTISITSQRFMDGHAPATPANGDR